MSKATVKKILMAMPKEEKTMAFIDKNNMLEHFKPRLRQCMEWASPCGWGFADTIGDIYYEYFPEDD